MGGEDLVRDEGGKPWSEGKRWSEYMVWKIYSELKRNKSILSKQTTALFSYITNVYATLMYQNVSSAFPYHRANLNAWFCL